MSATLETRWASSSWLQGLGSMYPFLSLIVNYVWEVKTSKKAPWLSVLLGRKCTLFSCCIAELGHEDMRREQALVAVLGQWERRTGGCMKPVMQGSSFLEEIPRVCWCFIHFKAFGSHLVVKTSGMIPFSFFLTEDVSLKREAVCHSACSTYVAVAILFFLPDQAMQQHFFPFILPLCFFFFFVWLFFWVLFCWFVLVCF